jgi:hypothetical protein
MLITRRAPITTAGSVRWRRENHLNVAIRAGEMNYKHGEETEEEL